jgi:hypothetical protein
MWIDTSNVPLEIGNTSNLGNFLKIDSGSNAGNIYYVDCDGRSELLRSEPQPAVVTPIAIAIGSLAELTALEDKPVGGLYIVTDGPNAGDVMMWSDTNDDDIGDEFVSYYVPSNNDDWSITTSLTLPSGTYNYDASTDTWTRTSGNQDIVSNPIDNPTSVGGVLMGRRHLAPLTNNSGTFILYDQVSGFGRSQSHATDDGSIVAPTAQESIVRKSPFTYYAINKPYAQMTTRRPFATDVQMNGAGTVVLDDLGNVWFKGTAAFMVALTETSSSIASAYVIDTYFASRSVKVIKVWLSYSTNNVIALAGDGTVWVRGASGTTGIYGDGVIVTDKVWHKASVPKQAYVSIYLVADGTVAYALGMDGKLYAWGTNTANTFVPGAVGVISSPQTIALTGKTIAAFAADTNSTMLVDNTGTRWAIGTNSNGKFGDGTTTAKTSYTSLPTNGFLISRVFSGDGVGNTFYYYITTTKMAVYTGYASGQRGVSIGTGNVTSLTKMGNGSYQGAVVDIRSYHNSTLIHTSQGTVWTCVSNTGSSYAEHGWGINLVAGTGTGLNVFKQVPIPSVVVSVQSSSESASTVNTAQYTVLTDEGRVYNWGGSGLALDEAHVKHAPYEIPIGMYKQGTPKTNAQADVMILTSVLASLSSGSATIIRNGGTNTVTFTVPYTGTLGVLSTAGWTITMPDGTVTNIETPLYVVATSGTLTFTATVTGTTVTTLVAPNTQPQTYVLTAGSLSSTITGTRTSDVIYNRLSTSAATYASASPNAIVPVTAAEYDALAAVAGATKYAGSDGLLNLTSTYFGGGSFKMGIGGFTAAGQSATYAPAGTYAMAYKIKSGITSNLAAGTFRFESLAASTSNVLYNNAVIIGDGSPTVSVTAGQFSHFVIKQPSIATTTQSAFAVDQISPFMNTYNNANAIVGNQYSTAARPRTAMTNVSYQYVFQYQTLGTSNKQW